MNLKVVIYAPVLSAKCVLVQKQQYIDYSENCRTPGDCKIKTMACFMPLKAISFVESLKWHLVLWVTLLWHVVFKVLNHNATE